MILSGCRVVCLGSRGLKDLIRHMVTQMGATTYDVVDYSCTHLVGASMNDETIAFTQSFYPWVRIVHARWVARCWTRGRRASEKEYDLPFYLQAQRTGTYTILGCKNIFFAELMLFDLVQLQIGATALKDVLRNTDARSHARWPWICHMLKNTVFWGHFVRNRNWMARRQAVMALARHAKDPVSKRRKRPRLASDGPAHVLLRVASLPCELTRSIVEYL